MRLDIYLVEKGFAESREKAKTLIKSGAVAVDGRVITKPAEDIMCEGGETFGSGGIFVDGEHYRGGESCGGGETSVNSELCMSGETSGNREPCPKIEILNPLKYVSRGGYKLEFALENFSVNPGGKTCMDIGASTGGFTDCLLKRGARRVIAVDVGTAQLHPSLKADPRVVSIEQSDFRKLDFSGEFSREHSEGITSGHSVGITRELSEGITKELSGEPINLFVCDISFISAVKILPGIRELMKGDSRALILIKPQFEIFGRRKNGVIKSERDRKAAVKNVLNAAEALGLETIGVKECPFTGKDGNIEYFLYVKLKSLS
jgi:23S rRNA (cytidine1920-2'-O)/16S rRNA (cytidine1409-2'-O)-methyltransferase